MEGRRGKPRHHVSCIHFLWKRTWLECELVSIGPQGTCASCGFTSACHGLVKASEAPRAT